MVWLGDCHSDHPSRGSRMSKVSFIMELPMVVAVTESRPESYLTSLIGLLREMGGNLQNLTGLFATH